MNSLKAGKIDNNILYSHKNIHKINATANKFKNIGTNVELFDIHIRIIVVIKGITVIRNLAKNHDSYRTGHHYQSTTTL